MGYVCDDDSAETAVRPKITLTPLHERIAGILKEDLEREKPFDAVWRSIKKKYPSGLYEYTAWSCPAGVSEVGDFKYRAAIVFPEGAAGPKDAAETRGLYLKTAQRYEEWKKENGGQLIPAPGSAAATASCLAGREALPGSEGFFGEGGRLSETKGFSVREGQRTLAADVENAIERGGVLLANAPTGIGKTMAYLFNTVKAAEQGKRVLISTHTKKLQDQIRFKDIPALEGIIKRPVPHTVLKGKDNYVCMLNTVSFVKDPSSSEVLRDLVREYVFNRGVTESDELPVPAGIRGQLSPSLCAGKACPYYDVCAYYTAIKLAKLSPVVIINHAILINELKRGRLGEFQVLIADEAHHLEHIITESLGGELSSSQFDFLKVRGNPGRRLCSEWKKTFPSLETASRQEGMKLLEYCDAAAENINDEEEKYFLEEKAAVIKRYFLYRESYHVERIWRESGEMFRLYPYSISSWVRTSVWNRFPSVIFMSGTLFMDEGVMKDMFKTIMGVPEDQRFVFRYLEPSYDYANNVRFFVPSDFPEYDFAEKQHYLEAVIMFLKEYIVRTEGRCLVLFTSHEDMNTVSGAMEPFFKENGIMLYVNSFDNDVVRENPLYAVFGTYSMWEGIDIEDDLLRTVVMIKSPFMSPDDGYFRSKSKELGEKMYYLFYMNNAAVKFRQGFGRLIRSASGRGVFVFLDNRLSKRSYNKFFLRSISEDMGFSLVPVREIFNRAEVFLFSRTDMITGISGVKSDYKFLDHRQVYIARDGERGVKIIRGAAGTGKTVILIHRLKYLLMKFPHVRNILFVTFNASLANYIKNILRIEGITEKKGAVKVCYLYELCRDAGFEKKPGSFDDFYSSVLAEMRQKDWAGQQYDAVFIDEGQDFDETKLEIVLSMADREKADLTVAIDHRQELYKRDFGRFFKNRAVKEYFLETSYRSSRPVTDLASLFVRDLFTPGPEKIFRQGIQPVFERFSDRESLMNGLVNGTRLYMERFGYESHDILITYPKRRVYGCANVSEEIARALGEAGIGSMDISSMRNKSTYRLLDGKVKLSTIHSAKGLEFRGVIVIGLDESPATNSGSRMAYVAVTRASDAVRVLYTADSGLIQRLGLEKR